ncbi:MAG: hypothetical protein IJ618_09250 [Prevotella sp.]|nr:hypothetical protein [Prevotella sp.]
MSTVVLERETKNYWNLIKDAGNEVKLALITLLSSSMSKDSDAIIFESKPVKAKRLHAMTDEMMAEEIKGEPIPLCGDENEIAVDDIVAANSGRLKDGMEKWL